MTRRLSDSGKWTVERSRVWVCWADLVTFVRRGGGLVSTVQDSRLLHFLAGF
jgi:hypothetical protein